MKNKPLKSARRPGCGNVDKANALTTVPQQNKSRSSGHLMCYQNRTCYTLNPQVWLFEESCDSRG